MEIEIKKLHSKRDGRGEVVEMLSEIVAGSKEALFITSEPGATRGNHYHKTKREFLCVVSGNARIKFESTKSSDKKELTVEGPVAIKVPTDTVHSVTNIGSSRLLIVEFSNQVYGQIPDTFKK